MGKKLTMAQIDVGVRLRLTGEGEKAFPRHATRGATVVGRARRGPAVRVRWDGNTSDGMMTIAWFRLEAEPFVYRPLTFPISTFHS